MVTISPELFHSTRPPYPGKVLLKYVPPKKLLLRVVPRELPQEFELRGWFVMGELVRRPSLIVFWTASHPDYQHSLAVISKLTPFSSKHLLVGTRENPLEGALASLVIDAFGILSFGYSFLNVLPTWFLATKEPEALIYLMYAVHMILTPSHSKVIKLLEKLEKFKDRTLDRIKSTRTALRPPHSVSSAYRTWQSITKGLDRLYGFAGPAEDFEFELRILSEKAEELNRLFCQPEYVVAQLKEEAHDLERWYRLMLEPGYLSAEVRATLRLWHSLCLESQLPEHKPTLVRNDIGDLLEFLSRLNFQFARRALAKLQVSKFQTPDVGNRKRRSTKGLLARS